MPYLQWLISLCIVYSRSQHENRLSLNMSSLLPVAAMTVNNSCIYPLCLGPLSLQCSNAVNGEKPASLTLGFLASFELTAKGAMASEARWPHVGA